MTHFQIWFLIPPPLIETFINVQVDRDLFFHYYHGRISHPYEGGLRQDSQMHHLRKIDVCVLFLKGDTLAVSCNSHMSTF